MPTSITYNKDFNRLYQLMEKLRYHVHVLGYLKKRLGKRKAEKFHIEELQARDVLLLQDLERHAKEMIANGVADKSLCRPVARVWLHKDTISKLNSPHQISDFLDKAERMKLFQYKSLSRCMESNERLRKIINRHINMLSPREHTKSTVR